MFEIANYPCSFSWRVIYDHVEIAERNIGGSWSFSRASLNLTFGHAGSFVELGHLPSPFCETNHLEREREREIPKGNNGWQIFTSRKLRASLCRHVFDNKINTPWHANKDASSPSQHLRANIPYLST